MTGREIIARLHAGERVFSSAIVGISPQWPELARGLDLDFVFLDTEHIPLDRQTLSYLCQTYSALGLPPVVRIPCNDPFEACKALDAGAGGIIGPYVESPEQVMGLVGAVKHRPLKGERLREALLDPTQLEPELAEYLQQRNADKILIANIESVPALNNLYSICAVRGLDAVLIGPHDLSCSLGVPEQYEHPKFVEAVRHIFRVARKNGIGAGIHYWMDLEREIAWAKEGGNLIMHASDLAAFTRTLKAEIAQLRQALAP
jgi:4-hydroxy-2-oxoheptanedioate aldolase